VEEGFYRCSGGEPAKGPPRLRSLVGDLQGLHTATEESIARNTGDGFRRGPVDDRTQVLNPTTGIWTKGNTSAGRFMEGKEDTQRSNGRRRK